MIIDDFSPGQTVEVEFFLQAVNSCIECEECNTASVSINGISYQEAAAIEVCNSNGGWGDSTNGRKEYSIEEINTGKLDNIITFNTISDGIIGHEFNYVGAKRLGEKRPWHASSIGVEDGETYTTIIYFSENHYRDEA